MFDLSGTVEGAYEKNLVSAGFGYGFPGQYGCFLCKTLPDIHRSHYGLEGKKINRLPILSCWTKLRFCVQ
jgi:hypothetical protein